MTILNSFLTVLQVLSAVAVIVLVLLQHGKGADMGAAFGSGSAGSLFGSSGSATFLSRLTAVCATIFLACTLGLSFYANLGGSVVSGSVMKGVVAPAAKDADLPKDVPATDIGSEVPAPLGTPSVPVQEIPK